MLRWGRSTWTSLRKMDRSLGSALEIFPFLETPRGRRKGSGGGAGRAIKALSWTSDAFGWLKWKRTAQRPAVEISNCEMSFCHWTDSWWLGLMSPEPGKMSGLVYSHHIMTWAICHILAFKGIFHPKMKILSVITHPHVVPNLQDLHSSSEHKLRYFWWNPRAFWPCIDSNTTTTFKAQKGSKDIIKIIHVTSVDQP